MLNAAQITNTEILQFICGWQGGTIHQLVNALNSVKHPFVRFDKPITDTEILEADYDRMQDLMRQAQMVRISKEIEIAKPPQMETEASVKQMKDPYFNHGEHA